MIDRIYLAKLTDSSIARAVAVELRDSLAGLPGAVEVRIGLPGDASSSRSWDLSLVVCCPDSETLGELLLSERFGQAYGRLEASSEVVKAWSFERL